ncbi:MAG: CHAP domain-containing protein, partial [Lachnospiraceae bacterium]
SEKSAKEGAIEFKSEWENAAKQVNLTGDWSEDVLTLAQSQLGYAENQAGGSEDQLGDSGSSDGEWSATFASFCLSYAKVEDFPLETDCGQWVQKLRERKYGIYREADGYTPTPGDLIFFDMNNSGSGEDKDDSDEQEIADHVGIVVEVMPATGAVSAKVKTIEGDSDDCVQYVIYDLTDARIMGYGKLPEKTE